MRVPLSWLASLVDAPDRLTGPDPDTVAVQVAADLVRVGLEEETIHGGDVSGPLVFGRVLEVTAEPQKNGKTINWCQVDVGAEHASPDGGPRGIVCGAHNFAAGDLVVVALPGAELPGGFRIASRKTYGHLSDGMMCSQVELGLGEDRSGIIVVPRLLGEQAAESLQPGQDALPVLGLDQHTIEVNVTPDRGYCFSVRGIAREYASAIGRPQAFSDPARHQVPDATADGFPIEVDDTAPIHGVAGCDRFATRIVRGVDPAAPTPRWLRQWVEQAGMRSISLIVDVTNYIMLGLGQPMHAYDLDTVTGPITVRRARPGEALRTLDDVERELHPEDLLITDAGDGAPGSRVIGLAGVMGGASTEISAASRDVLLEAAHFDSVSIARTARRHRLGSEASKRFERGVDPQLPPVAAELAVQLLVRYGGGTADERVGDLCEVPEPAPITLAGDLVARLTGIELTQDEIRSVLEEIGCTVNDVGSHFAVTPPSWRPDLVEGADLVEEVARLVGYDRIDSILPVAPAGLGLSRAQRIRRFLLDATVAAGWNEVLSYPFVGADVFEDLGYPAEDRRRSALRLANPLREEAPLLRTSLLATLAELLRRNLSRGGTDLALIELGTVFLPEQELRAGQAPILAVRTRPDQQDVDRLITAVPHQAQHLAGVACGNADAGGWWGPGRAVEVTDVIGLVGGLLTRLGIGANVRAAQIAPWHPGRCAQFVAAGDERVIGHAGELHPRVCERLALPKRTVAFELDVDTVVALVPERVPAHPVSPYPVVKEDIALVVDAGVSAAQVTAVLRAAGGPELESVRLFDVYAGPQVGEGNKSLAYNLRMRAADRTLTSAETKKIREAVVKAAADVFEAQLRGA